MQKALHFVDLLSRWALLRLMILFALATLLGCNGAQFETQDDGGRLPTCGAVQVDSGVDVLTSDLGSSVVVVDIGSAIDEKAAALDTGFGCMYQVIARGYSSAEASCSDSVSVGFNRDRFSSAQDACRFVIGCFAENSCNGIQESSSCTACMYAALSGMPSPLGWWWKIIQPYCPNFTW